MSLFWGHLLLLRKAFEHSFPDWEPFPCSPLPEFHPSLPFALVHEGLGPGWKQSGMDVQAFSVPPPSSEAVMA